MKITTASGTQYVIEDIKQEEGKAFNMFTGYYNQLIPFG